MAEVDESGLAGPEEFGTSNELKVRPDVNLLETYLDEVHKGQLRVPKFQRPFVWRPEQMLDLFDSIERGYPIGSLLLWQTDIELESLGEVGGLSIPNAPGRSTIFILDGHQRLSTLYSCLYRTEKSDNPNDPTAWIWHIYRVLGQSENRATRYVHWRKAGPPPANYLPIRSVLKTLDFLSYARRLGRDYNDDVYNAMVEEAEEVAQRIKSYKLSVVTLVGGSLTQAVEVFSRVNSKGQPMSPDQMVSALTYKGGEESLANRIEAILEGIAAQGFGQINETVAFRSVLAVAGEEEVTGARWDVLARRVEGRLAQATSDTNDALTHAVAFLREQIGVPLARLVPYNNQLMLLALFFHLCPEPSEDQAEGLVRWFWITSWSGQFASVNSTTSRQSIQDMRAFATGAKTLDDFTGGQGMFDFAEQRPRPFPDRFDLRSARVRAYLLWELRQFPDRNALNGKRYEAIDAIRKLDTAAFQRIWNTPGLPSGSSPANRVILDANPGLSSKSYMLRCLDRAAKEGSLGITQDVLYRFRLGDEEGFISLRAAELARLEQQFIQTMGAAMPPAAVGDIEIDTE
ncbi:DUF262 domain-containing protein [Nonomuraea sp. NPDC003201]